MNPKILESLFLDAPAIPGEALRFCQSMPGYDQAQQEYQALAGEVTQAVGRKRYLAYEAALNRCWAMDNRAHYLLGLALRREILSALAPRG